MKRGCGYQPSKPIGTEPPAVSPAHRGSYISDGYVLIFKERLDQIDEAMRGILLYMQNTNKLIELLIEELRRLNNDRSQRKFI